MKATHLSNFWQMPDNTRLMKRQTSVRLAVHIEAKIAALCDLYPGKSKSQLINDLLSAALDDLESGFEKVKGNHIGQDYDVAKQQQTELYYDVGPRRAYLDSVNKHLAVYEAELGNDSPSLYSTEIFVEEYE